MLAVVSYLHCYVPKLIRTDTISLLNLYLKHALKWSNASNSKFASFLNYYHIYM